MGYVTDVSYATINNANALYLIINKVNGNIDIDVSNVNKYLTLVPTDESKDKQKIHEELCNKIRDLIRSIINSSGNYDEKYVKNKFNSSDSSIVFEVIKTILGLLINFLRRDFSQKKKAHKPTKKRFPPP